MRETGRTATEIKETAGLGVRRHRTREREAVPVVVTRSLIEMLSTYEGTGSATSIAQHVGVTPSKLRELMDQHEELSAAVLNVQRQMIANVEGGLYKRSVGMEKTYTETSVKHVFDPSTKQMIEVERVKRDKVVITPPDVAAQKYLLANRDPDNWTEKQKLELDGGLVRALKHAADRLKLVDLSPDEWEDVTDGV